MLKLTLAFPLSLVPSHPKHPAIDAFCRKCKDEAGSKAQETVDRMVRLYSLGIGYDRPTRIVFNALINAWSRSSGPNAAQQAEKIFRWMESQYQAGDDYVKPDEQTLCLY